MKKFVGGNLCLVISFASGKKRWKWGQNKSFSCAKTKVTHWDSDGWTSKKTATSQFEARLRIFEKIIQTCTEPVRREIICRNRIPMWVKRERNSKKNTKKNIKKKFFRLEKRSKVASSKKVKEKFFLVKLAFSFLRFPHQRRVLQFSN